MSCHLTFINLMLICSAFLMQSRVKNFHSKTNNRNREYYENTSSIAEISIVCILQLYYSHVLFVFSLNSLLFNTSNAFIPFQTWSKQFKKMSFCKFQIWFCAIFDSAYFKYTYFQNVRSNCWIVHKLRIFFSLKIYGSDALGQR